MPRPTRSSRRSGVRGGRRLGLRRTFPRERRVSRPRRAARAPGGATRSRLPIRTPSAQRQVEPLVGRRPAGPGAGERRPGRGPGRAGSLSPPRTAARGPGRSAGRRDAVAARSPRRAPVDGRIGRRLGGRRRRSGRVGGGVVARGRLGRRAAVPVERRAPWRREGRRPTDVSIGCTPANGSSPSPGRGRRRRGRSRRPRRRCPTRGAVGAVTTRRPSRRLMTRSCSCTRPWSTSQSSTRLSMSVGPPKSQWRMWWACRRSTRVSGQPGRAHPPSRRSSARHCALVARRRRRPTRQRLAALLEHRDDGRLAEHPARLGAGDRRAALDVRPAGGGVVGEDGGVDVDDDLAARWVAGRRRSTAAPDSTRSLRAVMRRAAVRSRTRPTAASSAQRSSTSRSTLPPAARIAAWPAAAFVAWARSRRASRSATGLDPRHEGRALDGRHADLEREEAVVVVPVLEGLLVLRGRLRRPCRRPRRRRGATGGRSARSARRSRTGRSPRARPRSRARRCGSAPGPSSRTAVRR